MKKDKYKEPQIRDRILAVKVTVDEKKEITKFAEKQCVNVSALVRKLLFNKLKEDV